MRFEDTTDTDNEALSDGDDSNIGTVLIAVGALVIVAAVGVLCSCVNAGLALISPALASSTRHSPWAA